MSIKLVDWITNNEENIVDDTNDNIVFGEYTVSLNTPILYYSSSKKIIPKRLFSIHGVGLKGNIALKAVGVGGIETLFYIPENSNETYLELISQFVVTGKFLLSCAYYEVDDVGIQISDFSNEIEIYSYKTIEESKNNYCPVYSQNMYVNALLNLLPNGIFAKNIDSNIYKLLNVFASELNEINILMCDLKKELNPISTTEFLELWEEEYNSGRCTSNSTTFEARKKELVAKYIAIGGNTPYYFEYIASIVGYDIKVVDDNNVNLMTCEDNCEDSVVTEEMGFVWYIDVFGFTQHFMTCENNCESSLDWIEGREIECFFEVIKPAHTILRFRYQFEYEITTDNNESLITDDDLILITK